LVAKRSTKYKKSLPEDWKTVYVRDYFTVDAPYTDSLRLRKQSGRSIQAEFLPPESKDPRSRKTKDNRRITKRLSTGKVDPLEAVEIAVELEANYLNHAGQETAKIEDEKKYSLQRYWEIWFDQFCKDQDVKRNGKNNIRNQSCYWKGEEYGIMHQPFVKKKVDSINAKDLIEYWRVLDLRGKRIGNDMAGTKKQIKTLLNKLIKTARIEDPNQFGNLQNLIYPEIKSFGKEEVEYFTRQEFKKIQNAVLELSDFNAFGRINVDDYWKLEWSSRDRLKGTRNWMDLHAAIGLIFYYYLRAEDLPRIKSEWIHRNGNNKTLRYLIYLETLKGNRIKKHYSYPYLSDSNHFITILKRTKTEGYLVFPMYERDPYNPVDSQVNETLNYMLQHVVKLCGIKKRQKMTMTNIRHTAFYLTIQENPELFNTESKLKTFAENGHTSAEMLRETYINKIDTERQSLEAVVSDFQKKIDSGESIHRVVNPKFSHKEN